MDDLLYFDGSSLDKGRRGGPGFSAGAAVLIRSDGRMETTSVFLRKGESNLAEYHGLLCGLKLAVQRDVRRIGIYGDSRNVIDHVRGWKRPKKLELLNLGALIEEELRFFESWSLEWIPRRKNLMADAEARRCRERAGTPEWEGSKAKQNVAFVD